MHFLARLIMLALAIQAASCTFQPGVPANGEQNSWTIPHVLRWADGSEIDTLNPDLTQSVGVNYLSSMTAAWLVKWDARNQPFPELATELPTQSNGGISNDGLTITYHLRKALRWSDGAPLTSADLAWTYRAIMNPANNVGSRAGWDRVRRVDTPNKETIIFHLAAPYSPFLETFFSSSAGGAILPKHLLARYANINSVAFNALPIGAGPFMYKEWKRAQSITLVPNPYYFRGRPRLHEIRYEIIPKSDTLLTELRTHDLDMWWHVQASFDRVRELQGYSGKRISGGMWTHLDFNLTRPLVQDREVRRALEFGLNRQQLIDKVMHSAGVLQEGVAPIGFSFGSRTPIVPYDPARAEAILDADRWKPGGDGIRQKDGIALRIKLVVPSGSSGQDRIIELMRSDWAKIGVALDTREVPGNLLLAPATQGGIIAKGAWDLTLFEWYDDAIGNFYPYYGCDQFWPAGSNDLRWCNRRAQQAMLALFGHYDQSQRDADDRSLYAEMERDIPQITIFGVREGYLYNNDLRNFNPSAATPFDDMMNVDI